MEPELDALYPFLAPAQPADRRSLEDALVLAIATKAEESRGTNARFFASAGPTLLAAALMIANSYRRDGKLLAMGNGGSSCDAAHVAVEFVHPVTTGRRALAALDLGASLPALTAVANDVGYAHVFVRQLIALGRTGDVLIGFSTSGHSENLLAAFAKAKELGITTIGMSGGDGGAMKAVVDHCLVVESTSIHRIQEAHVVAYHILWDLVHTLLARSAP